MSSVHNDLATWAGKARSRGLDTIEITCDLAEKAAETIVKQANRIADLECELRSSARNRGAQQ